MTRAESADITRLGELSVIVARKTDLLGILLREALNSAVASAAPPPGRHSTDEELVDPLARVPWTYLLSDREKGLGNKVIPGTLLDELDKGGISLAILRQRRGPRG
jgi:hypothetical protein